MALDEPKDNDDIFEIDGFTYLIDKHLLASAQPVLVDFSAFGFRITGRIASRKGPCS
jgi:iron-sulfur cluster assembly protein